MLVRKPTVLAGRYARATYDLAAKSGEVDKVMQDLSVFKTALDDVKGFRDALTNLYFPRVQQEALLDSVLDKIKAAKITRNLIDTLLQNRRIGLLYSVYASYELHLMQLKGIVRAEVRSARDLSDVQKQQIAESLKERLKKDIELKCKVDPSLIGGMAIIVGSKMIDNSIQSKINRLYHFMRGAS